MNIKFIFINPLGEEEGVGSGVSREIYSSFWKEVSKSLLIGESERVPYVRHDMFTSEWQAVGIILVKGFIDTRYFPTIISQSFIQYILFGIVDNNDLVCSFYQYLSNDEKEMLERCVESNNDEDFTTDDFFEFLEQYKVHSKVTKQNIKDIVAEIALKELVQKPHIMAACWKGCFERLKKEPEFSSKESIKVFYESVVPTSKRIIALIDASPNDDAEKDALNYFKRFIRGLNQETLKKLLRFITGSDIIVVDSIGVTFTKPESSFSRRPIPHICAPCLELPATYNNFCELREELTNILDKNNWDIDIV